MEFARFYPTFSGDEREGAEGLIALVFHDNVYKNGMSVEKKDQNECAIYKYNNLIIRRFRVHGLIENEHGRRTKKARPVSIIPPLGRGRMKRTRQAGITNKPLPKHKAGKPVGGLTEGRQGRV